MIPSTKGKKENATQIPVIPAGSSWIICDSKSRPGFKYYFNTESGEAVWNLSNKDQIETAKKHTHILHTKLGIVPELPEPQDQPPMNARTNLNRPMSNFSHFLNPSGRRFDGNVWANPPGVVQQPQIVLVPTVAPLFNSAIASNNLHPTLALQNALPFTYQSYGGYNVPYNNSNHRGRMFYKNSQFQRHHNQNSTNYGQGGVDLRQKLARKRSASESNLTYKKENFNSNDSEDDSTNSSKPEFSGFGVDKGAEDIQNKFKLDDCFVVVDKDIILSEFVFFDNLVSNDPNFRLVVPHHVLSELKTDACKSGEARVRRIVRFLSQKIESDLVYLGDEIEENSRQNLDKTFITCEKLVEYYDNDVILVSEKSETRKFKGNNEKIKIMSMCKFKDVLSNAKARFSSPTRAIKIVIPNNFKIDEKTNLNANDSARNDTDVERKATNTIRKVTNIEIQVKNSEEDVTNVERNVETHCILSPSSKPTVDTAVQTEIDKEVNKICCNFPDTNLEVDTNVKNDSTRKREIRLKRTTPMKKARIEETPSDKKQFKWRKNRATNNNSNNSEQKQSTSHVPTNIAPKTIVNTGTDNSNVKESKQKENSSQTDTDNLFAIPKPNLLLSSFYETITNIAPKAIVDTSTDNLSNVKESKQKENSSQTDTDNLFAIPKPNLVVSSIVERELVKKTPIVAEKDTKMQEVLKQTSTESWVESLPNSKSNTDKDSISSSHGSVNKTNSSSSTHVYNVNSIVHKVPLKPLNKNIVLKKVEMFTITGPSMEEVLRLRSDEWVSRFVQIMEEILKEKLQENPQFQSDEYPPPWNLNEAAKCIIKKYSNFFNVVNAANQLSFILYKISDEKEKIPLTLQPSDFMEMYSYGMYLIETLQDVSTNCDDLNAAKEALKTLLHDIQNANTENSCTDLFGDDLPESYVENTTSTDITESDFRPDQQQSTPKRKSKNRCATRTSANKKLKAESSRSLRSTKKTSEIPEVTQSKSSCVDKKSNFFANLKLMTRSISSPSTIPSPAYSNLTVRSSLNSPVKSPMATKLIHNNRENVEESLNNDEEIVSSSGQPNFVRNFQVCPEFEARINKARSILELDDCDDHDSDDHFDDDEFHYNISQPTNCVPQDNTFGDIYFGDNSSKKDYNKFKFYFGDPQLRYIKETFSDVIENLSATPDPSKRDENKSIAIKIFPCIENIYNSLDTILKNNAYYADANVKETLKNVNADSTEEEMYCLQYRNTITQFRDQAYMIIKYLKLILSSS